MNAVDMAKKAYGSNVTAVRTPRSIEYAAFARITQKLRAASSDKIENFSALASALHENRRLWTILAVDAADKDNALPQSLKGQIVYLRQFVNLHSSKILRGDANADPLIDINTAMMRGLGQEARKE